MIPQAQKFNIPIYISDNASNDGTANVVKHFQKTYQFLHYSSNKINLGVDQNMIKAAHMGASAHYVWTIGARRILLPGMLEKVYNLLNTCKLDLLVLNDLNNTFLVPESQNYNSAEKIFVELNRNLTGLGFQVLPSEAWNSDTLGKYADTEWTIAGVTLEYIAQKEKLQAYFLAEPVATSSGPSHWRPKFFQIWVNWKKTIRLLPSVYSDNDKEIVIRKSVRYLFVSSIFTLIQLRIENILTAKTFEQYRQDLSEYTEISPTIAYVISRFPIFPLKIYFKIYEATRGILRKFIHNKKPLNPTRKTAVSYM
jgi:abequosyltransferase